MITRLLFDEWDPIGVKDAGAPADHYGRYAQEIVERWRLSPNVDQLHKYLGEAFVRCLGEPEVDPSRSLPVAMKIFEILNSTD